MTLETRRGGDQFAKLAEQFARFEGVTLPGQGGSRGFGSEALKVGGSIFAMHVRGNLVVKLPKERVDGLVRRGQAERFTANTKRSMKEWAVIASDDPADWARFAGEAHRFVSCGQRDR